MKKEKHVLINETGKKYGKWTVLRMATEDEKPSLDKSHAYFICECECGIVKRVSGRTLRTGQSISCGNCGTHCKFPPGVSARHALFRNAVCRAKRWDTPWSLTEDEFNFITSRPCFYCGVAPAQLYGNEHHNGLYTYNGIDRKNSDRNIGYTTENSVPCCGRCNTAKLDMSIDEFFLWIEKVYNFSVRKA